MANNTKRRGLYLTPEIEEWLVAESEKTTTKINELILKALTEYKDSRSKSAKLKKVEFEKTVTTIVHNYLVDIGVVK